MKQKFKGNLLMVSNYPSDTAYAWWLMEHFWKTLANLYTQAGYDVYLAFPNITSISQNLKDSDINIIELNLACNNYRDYKKCTQFLKDKDISCLYLTDQPYFSIIYALLRFNGIRNIVMHDHTPGDRPPVGGIKGII